MDFQLKLLIDKKFQKVLLAEVRKDMVDFLFSLLSLPIGSVAKLITEESITFGTLRNTYCSWEKLNHSFLSSSQMTANNLIPVIPSTSSSNFSLFLTSASPVTKERVYACKCNSNFTSVMDTQCKSCLSYMKELSYVGPGVSKAKVQTDGYVKVGLAYFVMDDLSTVPMTSPLESFALVSKMGHNDFSLLEEKRVSLDFQQGLELLKISLRSKNVLTDLFLAKKKDGHAEEAKNEK